MRVQKYVSATEKTSGLTERSFRADEKTAYTTIGTSKSRKAVVPSHIDIHKPIGRSFHGMSRKTLAIAMAATIKPPTIPLRNATVPPSPHRSSIEANAQPPIEKHAATITAATIFQVGSDITGSPGNALPSGLGVVAGVVLDVEKVIGVGGGGSVVSGSVKKCLWSVWGCLPGLSGVSAFVVFLILMPGIPFLIGNGLAAAGGWEALVELSIQLQGASDQRIESDDNACNSSDGRPTLAGACEMVDREADQQAGEHLGCHLEPNASHFPADFGLVPLTTPFSPLRPLLVLASLLLLRCRLQLLGVVVIGWFGRDVWSDPCVDFVKKIPIF